MSAGFLLLAGLLLAASIAVLIVPLWRRGAEPRPTVQVMLLICCLPVAATLLYRTWSNYEWSQQPLSADNPADMVAKLARRLEKEPDDRQGWLMLGRSYLVLGQTSQAARAYQRADRLSGGTDPEALLGWAEALFRGNEAEIDGRAGRLFERALELDPNSSKALLFGAITAQRRGELQLARDRFVKVQAGEPPAELKEIIAQQITQLDAQLATDGGTTAKDISAAKVMVTVKLGSKLGGLAVQDLPLFVLARRPGVPGPPLAVKRLAAQFPQTVDLTAADAMLPGNELKAGDTVEVVARLSRGGAPTAAAGDPFGVLKYVVGRDSRLDLTIDQLTPSR